nr:nuclear transport factor 2 family protein [Lutibacter maritimus]
MMKKFPIPPFNEETAKIKVQMAEDAWNTQDPIQVSKAYTIDSEWRNRTQFINGRAEIIDFLTQKWKNERHYKLKKELWGFKENRMAVRFEYEFQGDNDQWYRAYGNELWEFDKNGLMQKRYASINNLKIEETDRQL